MRTFGSVMAGVVALVALAVTLPLSWTATEVADEDGYVALSRAVLDDTETREAVVDRVVDELEQRLTDRLADLGFGATLVEAALDQVAQFVADGLATDVVIDAWGEAQREAHEQMFDNGVDTGFVIELAPLVEAVADAALVDLDVPVSVRLERDDPTSRRVVQAIDQSPALAVGAGALGLVALIGAVALARGRGAALAGVATGALIVIGLELVAGRGAVAAVDEVGSGSAVDLVAAGVADVARKSWETHLAWAAAGAAVVLAVGLVVAGAGRMSRGQRHPVS